MTTPSIIDLRSDTVTKPSPGMRAAMAAAPVGDDVFGEDPTVTSLEDRVASLLGKEAALFVPSGTMSNQIAIRAQTEPGDEILCDVNCHIYNYEVGGAALHSGVTCHTLAGAFGILDLSQLEGQIRPSDDVHQVRTRMVCLENTHNRGGGTIYPLAKIEAISKWARANGLIMHLDGARLWNAVVATGIAANEWAKHFDTVSVCFSKGLGAPVGSALAGPRGVIAKGRKIRKLLGGGMRQAGILAAACHYALDHHIERLADDHAHAQIIAQAAAQTLGLRLQPPEVATNLVWCKIDPALGTAAQLGQKLREQGLLVYCSPPDRIRLCTHLDVSGSQARHAADVIRALK